MSMVCLLLTLVIPDLAPPQVDTPDRVVINGHVTDEAGTALPGVVVTIDGTARETTTDGDGRFQIDGLRPGRYVIRAALSGFAPAEESLELTAGQPRTLALTLNEGAYVFERVAGVEDGYAVRRSLTSTRTSSELRHLPQSIQVINKDLTQDQGAVYLNDALRNASGVTMFSEYLDFNFRGFRAQDESVKVDGLNQVHDFFVKPRLLNVERVEVVKGPQSTTCCSGVRRQSCRTATCRSVRSRAAASSSTSPGTSRERSACTPTTRTVFAPRSPATSILPTLARPRRTIHEMPRICGRAMTCSPAHNGVSASRAASRMSAGA
ncbi:MAG: TonB-dependent receptor plug domain-containing protein [Luteitalea sp.]|nr:TonB-dependent receptor plug domain-containing protein [Luteitalea sp.]